MGMLCALYGLRSIEVFRLEQGDIDWRSATFVVRRAKRGGIQHFPLLHEVGEAILDYLKHDRPTYWAARELESVVGGWSVIFIAVTNLDVELMGHNNTQTRAVIKVVLRTECFA